MHTAKNQKNTTTVSHFFYLVQLTGGSHPSGGHRLAREILLLNGDYLLKLGLEPLIGGH